MTDDKTAALAVAPYAQRAEMLLAILPASEITNAAELEAANLLIKQIKTRSDELAAVKKQITQPMRAALAAVSELFTPVEEKYAEAEKQLKTMVVAYLTHMESQARLAIGRAAESGDDMGEAVELALTSTQTPEGMQVRRVSEVVVFDEASVPREYLTPDLKKIKAAVKTGIDIPGVRVETKKQVAVSVPKKGG